MARHWNPIMMNAVLFGRIALLHDNRADARADRRSRCGCWSGPIPASTAPAPGSTKPAKKRMAEINERLAHLGTAFSHHLLGDEQDWFMELGEADRDGLSDSFVAAAKAAAEERGMAGKAVDDAVALVRRAVPEELDPARPAREGLQGLHRARRQRQRQRQQRDHRRDPGAARGERQAAGLSDLRRLSAGGFHGQDAGGRARPPGAGLEAGAGAGAGRPRRAAGAGRGGGRQFRARAVGLALLRRKAAPAPRQFRRRRDQALSGARPHDRGRLRLRHPPVRGHLLRAQGHSGLASGRPGLGGQGRRGQAPGAVLWRLLRTVLEAFGRLDDLAARPAEARRRDRAAGHQCLQFRQGRRRRAIAAVAGRRPHPVPRIRPWPARHAVERDLSVAVGHQRVHRFRRAAVAALRALAGAAAGAAAVRPALPDRRAAAGRSAASASSPRANSTRALPPWSSSLRR